MSKELSSRATSCFGLIAYLINDFCKLLQGGAHHLIIAPQRKTLHRRERLMS